MRTCNVCQQSKPEEAFYLRYCGGLTRMRRCGDCHKADRRKRYAEKRAEDVVIVERMKRGEA